VSDKPAGNDEQHDQPEVEAEVVTDLDVDEAEGGDIRGGRPQQTVFIPDRTR
jgi:hypothetical protein